MSTIETLVHLGADIQELDHAGNTVLHKAIQVCTSKSVASVAQLLITKGVAVNTRNREGNMPIHAECKR